MIVLRTNKTAGIKRENFSNYHVIVHRGGETGSQSEPGAFSHRERSMPQTGNGMYKEDVCGAKNMAWYRPLLLRERLSLAALPVTAIAGGDVVVHSSAGHRCHVTGTDQTCFDSNCLRSPKGATFGETLQLLV